MFSMLRFAHFFVFPNKINLHGLRYESLLDAIVFVNNKTMLVILKIKYILLS